MPVLVLMGMILSSCCSIRTCEVTVNFVGAAEELGLETYAYPVDFNEGTKVSFDIPAGYDHTQLKLSIDGVEQEYEVEFEEEVAEEYQYAVSKRLTYSVLFIKRSFELKVDLTNMQKCSFDVTLDSSLKDFKLLLVDEASLEGVTNLNKDNIKSSMDFVSNTVTVNYGESVFLMHNKYKSKTHYETLYSKPSVFTPDSHKGSVGTVNYDFYNVAKKGNGRYYYDNNNYQSLYYLGQIKEDIKLYSYIPNYTPDKGFDIVRDPNIFYLFTNPSEFNSDMCTIETYTSTNINYDSNDETLDKVGEVVLKKTTRADTYNYRYDIHQVYLGSDLNGDNLLSNNQKEKTNKDLYIKVSSSIGIENLKFKLLHHEREVYTNYNLNADIISEKGYTFIKLSNDAMMDFSIEREKVDTYGQVYPYLSGSAIFYVEINEDYYKAHKNIYSRIWLRKDIIDKETVATQSDFNFTVYVKNGDKKNYGLVDYHYEGASSSPRDCVYIETNQIFDENRMYRGTLFCDALGPDYEGYRTIIIDQMDLCLGYGSKSSITPNRTPIKIENPKQLNGWKEFLVSLKNTDLMSSVDQSVAEEYTLTIDVDVTNPLTTPYVIDFTYLDIPDEAGSMVYLTNNVSFETLSDFVSVRYSTREDFKTIRLSSDYDAYYFVQCYTNPDFDFDIYLDPNDRSTKVSSSKTLCDITGKPLTIEFNYQTYYVKVIVQDLIYETLDGKIYAMAKES